MSKSQKFMGVYPAFYACYDDNGEISASRTRDYAGYLVDKGIDGLYVCGSSGECVYQTVPERKKVLEAVMSEVKGKACVIAHVACNGVAESRELARHAQRLGVDAIAAIPPIYFRLPESSIAEYWNAISQAASDTPFFVYNIPQLAGTELTQTLLERMLENKNVVGVKNSSPSIMDIVHWRAVVGDNFRVFNGCDEQLLAGLAVGACGGIGGTYGAMSELYVKLYDLFQAGEIAVARELQTEIYRIILDILSAGYLYAVIKEILRKRGIDIGGVRSPLPRLADDAAPKIEKLVGRIDRAIETYC